MSWISLTIQSGIGVVLAAHGAYSLLRRRAGEGFACALACILAGAFLLGWAVWQAA